MAEERQRAIEAGMNDHITKPIDPDALFATLRRYSAARINSVPAGVRDTANAGEFVALDENLDVESALSRVAGNAALYRELLQRFVSNHADAPEPLRAAMEAGDRNAAHRIAHATRGVAGNIGATALQAAAARLETILGEGNRRADLRAGAVAAFEQEVERITQAIRKTFRDAEGESSDGPRTSPGSTNIELEILDYIDRLAEESDSSAVDYLESMRGSFLAAFPGESFDRLHSLLASYDFDGAQRELALLRARA